MKKRSKGFTLIELLAVIVILAVIALVATPTILGVIETAKISSSEVSVLGYINAIENKIMLSALEENDISDGNYYVEDLSIDIKGQVPDEGYVVIEKGIVQEAKLCINKYSFDYKDSKAKISNNNYCSSEFKVELVDGNNKETKIIKKVDNVSFTLGDLTGKTNIVCNNGAEPSVDGNVLKVDKIFGDVKCSINNSLEDTINDLDDSENSIIMINNEDLTNNLIINKSQNINFNLNDKKIVLSNENYIRNFGVLNIVDGDIESNVSVLSLSNDSITSINNVNIKSTNTENASAICSNGKLTIDGNTVIEGPYAIGCHNSDNAETIINSGVFIANSRNAIQQNEKYSSNVMINDGKFIGKIFAVRNMGYGSLTINNGNFISESQVVNNSSTGTITINGGYYERTAGTGAAIYNQGTGVINLNNCDVLSSGVSVQNGVGTGTTDGIININSGNYISLANRTILNYWGTININQTDKPIYIKTESKSWNPAIVNNDKSTINIKGNKADKCTSNSNDTTSGLCVYSGEFGTGAATDSNGAVQNNGFANINGGTYYGAFQGFNNGLSGKLNVLGDTKIITNRFAILNNNIGTINICSLQIDIINPLNNIYGDLVNNNKKNDDFEPDGTINYSNSVIFSGNSNIPKIYANNGIINSDYNGTCNS